MANVFKPRCHSSLYFKIVPRALLQIFMKKEVLHSLKWVHLIIWKQLESFECKPGESKVCDQAGRYHYVVGL